VRKDGLGSPFGPFGHVRGRGENRYWPAVMLMIVTIRLSSAGLRDHVLVSAA
jgi:hypothetical protein